MIDRNKARELLVSRRYAYSQIAATLKCSVAAVGRIAKELGVSIGQGGRRYWHFKESSIGLCYVIGAYLTDGNVGYSHKDKTCRQFHVCSTDIEFIDALEVAIENIDLNPSIKDVDISRKLGNKPQTRISVYSTMFATWLVTACNKKSSIPGFIFDAPTSHQVAFVSAAIDGDGNVTKAGTIKIRGIDHWLYDLPRLLDQMGIRTTGCQTESILESGKPYLRVGIRREDFRALNPVCGISEKQNRVLYGVETRKRTPRRRKYRCGACGEMNVSRPDATQCISCYASSKDLHDRLRKMNKDRHG